MRRFRPAAALLALLLVAPPLLLRTHARTQTSHALAAAAYDGIPKRAARRKPARNNRRRRRQATANASAGENGAASFRVEEIKEARLAELMRRGDDAPRPLLINFWATWCEPCRKEFPDLVLVDREFRPRGLDFITVSIDDVSELQTGVPQFLREMRATRIPAYLLNADDPETAIRSVDDRWRGELPATFLYDRAGKLAYKHVGRVNLEELRTAIKKVMSDE
ncbi:MAG TPA: TlpA disulfide reductase family protein [Pyrinomonadaceae bacterium]|nr:TlpA disulfide reductase family protein [Pyrinomonadaceae bacterium]